MGILCAFEDLLGLTCGARHALLSRILLRKERVAGQETARGIARRVGNEAVGEVQHRAGRSCHVHD